MAILFLAASPESNASERQKEFFPFFNYADFKLNATFSLPQKNKTDDEKQISGNSGVKLSFRNADVRGYWTLPKTAFSEIRECKSWKERKDLFLREDLRYGGGISIFKDSFPVSVKAGMLSFGKSYSRLKNPAPEASSNPLKKTFSFTSGLGPSLPTISSAKQPLSVYFSAGLSEAMFRIPLSIEFFRNDEKTCAASIGMKFPFTKYVSLESGITAGRFFLDSSSTVLKKNNALFEAGWFNAALAEISLRSPFVRLRFCGAIHESPYDNDCIWAKGEGRFIFRNFLLDASYFFIPTSGKSPKAAPLIGGSSSICRILEQAEINPQLKFLLKDRFSGSLALGILFNESWRISTSNIPEEVNLARIAAAVSYENRIFSLRTDGMVSNFLLHGKVKTKSSLPEKFYSLSEEVELNAKSLNSALKGTYRYYPKFDGDSSIKESLDISLKCLFGKNKMLTAQSALNMTFKDRKRHSCDLDSSIGIKLRGKFVTTSVKVGATCRF